MEIKVLGTVSPWPKGDMNCPGFLVSDKDNKIMLDCGNGSTSLLDMYKDLKNLTLIISHFHPDHYGDLFALANATFVQNKYGFLDKRVEVLIPPEIEKVRTYGPNGHTYKDNIPDYNFIKNTKHENYFDIKTYSSSSKIKIGNISISFYKTIHDLNAHAIKLESEDGIIVYSSDTTYDQYLAEFAANSDIFICEASFLKGQVKGSAKHLYAYEAGRLANLANVKDLYLYHTFPEIEKEQYLNEALEEFASSHIIHEGEILTLNKKN